MAKNWKMMAARLRANQERNLKNYALQNEISEKRIKELSELQNSQSAALRIGRGRR